MSTARLTISSCQRLIGKVGPRHFSCVSGTVGNGFKLTGLRRLSSSGNRDDKSNSNTDHADDPFGLNFDDGTEPGNLGTTLPPKYKRDKLTGKFTGEEEKELTAAEKKILNMDPIEEQEYLLEKVFNDWDLEEQDESSGPKKLSEFAQRVRQDNMAMNTLGRSVEAQSVKSKLEDGEDGYVDKTGFSKPLSPAGGE